MRALIEEGLALDLEMIGTKGFCSDGGCLSKFRLTHKVKQLDWFRREHDTAKRSGESGRQKGKGQNHWYRYTNANKLENSRSIVLQVDDLKGGIVMLQPKLTRRQDT